MKQHQAMLNFYESSNLYGKRGTLRSRDMAKVRERQKQIKKLFKSTEE